MDSDHAQVADLQQQLAALADENQRLSQQIKRLVKTEHELYQFQAQLDNQIRIYRHLYEIGKQLNATLDIAAMLEIAKQFVLYQLSFECCLALLLDSATHEFRVQTLDGYYDDAEQGQVAGLRFRQDDPVLNAILTHGDHVICHLNSTDVDFRAWRPIIGMDEWAAFSLGSDRQGPVGVLIAGNTARNSQYHAPVTAESQFIVGLANLVTQVSSAINMSREIHAREQRLKLEARSRERIEQELRVARLIQQTLLPKELPQMRGWQIARHYQPARAVGGDFYDVLQLPDGQIGFVIGDVTDKGVPAALLMAITRSVLRAVAQRHRTPSEVLAEANMLLCPDVPRNMFVTCFYAILDPHHGRLQYANAGHNFPYRWHRGQAIELDAVGMPLGVLPTIGYSEQETMLEPGDSLLFYSDGLIEAHNTQRAMFGFDRLERLITEHGMHGDQLINCLLEGHARFTDGSWEQEDDMTHLTLQRAW